MGNTNNTNEQDTEFALCTVPENERKSYFSLTIVWTGFVFVITSMMAGGGLSAGLDFKGILLAVVLGNVFLSIIAVAVSYIASKTGLTFALLTKYSFGEKGSRVASMFVPVVNIGWYTIQAATYGHFIAQAFNWSGTAELFCMAVSAVIMGIFSMKGYKAISILGYDCNPCNRIPVTGNLHPCSRHGWCRRHLEPCSDRQYFYRKRNHDCNRYLDSFHCYLYRRYHALCKICQICNRSYTYRTSGRKYFYDSLRYTDFHRCWRQ